MTDRYLKECAKDGVLRDAMAAAEYPEAFSEAWCGKLLSRPLFVREEEIRAAAADLAGLFDLLAALPDRLFGGDTRAFCAAIGADDRRAAMMTRFGGTPPLYGRADLHHDGSGFRLLEFNVGSELGGVDMAEANRVLLRTKGFREFAEENRLGYVHTSERIARQFVEATQLEAPVVASLEGVGTMKGMYLQMHRSFQETMRRCGVEVLVGEVDQVEERDGRLYLQGRPIDLVLRYFSVNQMCGDPRNAEHAEPILRAHEEGRIVLWTTPKSSMFSYKSCLPLIADPEQRPELTEDEAALVDRVLPWTRTLTSDVVDLVRADRENMIVKPFAGFSGAGVQAGWDRTDREWDAALSECTDRGHIVQRRVRARPEPMLDPVTRAVQDWAAVWGVFVVPDGYAGTFVRAAPTGGDAIVNMGARSAGVTTAFHH